MSCIITILLFHTAIHLIMKFSLDPCKSWKFVFPGHALIGGIYSPHLHERFLQTSTQLPSHRDGELEFIRPISIPAIGRCFRRGRGCQAFFLRGACRLIRQGRELERSRGCDRGEHGYFERICRYGWWLIVNYSDVGMDDGRGFMKSWTPSCRDSFYPAEKEVIWKLAFVDPTSVRS
jgi:hypothetical protein